MNCDQAATTEILWTGGWDSTFRVLDLLARCDGTIQPHYLRDRDRASWKLEVETMEAIREHANRRFGSRILPPKLSDRTDIEVPEQVKAWFRLLNQQFRLGSQYIWLSQYSLNETDGRLELCVHVDDKAHKAISWAQSHRDREEATEIVEAVDGLLLSTFHFPILDMSKIGMQRAARDAGFDDLLDRTWFCNKPTLDGRPCGFCGPCTWTIEEGLGYRIPGDRRFRANLYQWIGCHLPSWRLRQAFLRTVRGQN
ncbi:MULTISPECIES: hypothetical protein [Thioalkalivibrio]|uniref:hypothetical protein n=1 Tax=Thioalkalivibrio TaxID=106633 RepID=UPI00037271A1|nr:MULTISPECIES: hypothetical protein [Thioalkalivibrio]OOC50980.1 hypothetical protein B0684_01550 [Thioalkalivibrio versutus]